MINDVFKRVDKNICRSLFADDGALWFRGGNIKYVVRKMQNALKEVEEWSLKWGFKSSVEKTQVMFFTNKRIDDEIKLKLYNISLERVSKIRFLGIWFDSRLTWKEHIEKIEQKCKRVLNIMRCVSGTENHLCNVN